MMPASNVGPAWGALKWHKNMKKNHRVCLGTIGNVFCFPTMHPIASTGPTTEANIIALIPLFLRHPVTFCDKTHDKCDNFLI